MTEWKRGTTLRFVLEQESGTTVDDAIVSASLKKSVGKEKRPPGDASPVLVDFNVNYSAPSGDNPPRWFIRGTPSESEGLDPGSYVMDVKIELDGGETISSETVVIDIIERVTE